MSTRRLHEANAEFVNLTRSRPLATEATHDGAQGDGRLPQRAH
jgi:hypothetical protein